MTVLESLLQYKALEISKEVGNFITSNDLTLNISGTS